MLDCLLICQTNSLTLHSQLMLLVIIACIVILFETTMIERYYVRTDIDN